MAKNTSRVVKDNSNKRVTLSKKLTKERASYHLWPDANPGGYRKNEDATLLRAALNILKNEYNLEELKGDNYSHLIRISPLVKDDSLKALLIETIVESPYYTKNGSRLLEEYVQQLSKGTATVEAAARCLGAFTASVYSNNEILLQIAENVDHEFGIEILVTMGVPIGGRYQTIWGLWLCVFKKNREYDIVRG